MAESEVDPFLCVTGAIRSFHPAACLDGSNSLYIRLTLPANRPKQPARALKAACGGQCVGVGLELHHKPQGNM